jgi:hypothetical protein
MDKRNRIAETEHVLACYNELEKMVPKSIPSSDNEKETAYNAQSLLKVAIVRILLPVYPGITNIVIYLGNSHGS